jgi:hypothetical protein
MSTRPVVPIARLIIQEGSKGSHKLRWGGSQRRLGRESYWSFRSLLYIPVFFFSHEKDTSEGWRCVSSLLPSHSPFLSFI